MWILKLKTFQFQCTVRSMYYNETFQFLPLYACVYIHAYIGICLDLCLLSTAYVYLYLSVYTFAHLSVHTSRCLLVWWMSTCVSVWLYTLVCFSISVQLSARPNQAVHSDFFSGSFALLSQAQQTRLCNRSRKILKCLHRDVRDKCLVTHKIPANKNHNDVQSPYIQLKLRHVCGQ